MEDETIIVDDFPFEALRGDVHEPDSSAGWAIPCEGVRDCFYGEGPGLLEGHVFSEEFVAVSIDKAWARAAESEGRLENSASGT